jgi:hypothetical protein
VTRRGFCGHSMSTLRKQVITSAPTPRMLRARVEDFRAGSLSMPQLHSLVLRGGGLAEKVTDRALVTARNRSLPWCRALCPNPGSLNRFNPLEPHSTAVERPLLESVRGNSGKAVGCLTPEILNIHSNSDTGFTRRRRIAMGPSSTKGPRG